METQSFLLLHSRHECRDKLCVLPVGSRKMKSRHLSYVSKFHIRHRKRYASGVVLAATDFR